MSDTQSKKLPLDAHPRFQKQYFAVQRARSSGANPRELAKSLQAKFPTPLTFLHRPAAV
jgi:hypothetical protein